ncbi:hypothetical protein WA026_016289 [Henosepilachna vigintioctopunctata]|uniref:trypsin n=1 Tax=Henosepilachna vigintioctopunctata TaxID=420089 RepID=A0AAW1UPL3_9CUCU
MLCQTYVVLFIFLILELRNVRMHDRVVGGKKCSVEEVPFIVSIRRSFNFQHFCGGSLISSRWVLSAAHCFEKMKPSELRLLVGLSEAHRNMAQTLNAKSIFLHEDFDTYYYRNDIALVLLDHKVIMFRGVVSTIKLPPPNTPDDLSGICGSKFRLAGWGSTEIWSKEKPAYHPSPIFKCVELPYVTNDKCKDFTDFPSDNIMCTFVPEGGKDGCQGDSGGPLFCNSMQYGIVSFGFGCGAAQTPAFYTRVDKYLDFINKTIHLRNDSACLSILRFLLISSYVLHILIY